MFDARVRPLIDAPLNWAGGRLATAGVAADYVTLVGFALGMAAAVSIAVGRPTLALCLVIANRVADGLDGAVARVTQRTDRGAFLDIALDFVFYASVPLAFAVLDPANNALAATFLLASFLANGTAFLAFAALAEHRRMSTTAQGLKSLYYVAGIAEGTETVAAFIAMCLFPGAFEWLAIAFALLCLVSAAARITLGWLVFGTPR